MLNIAQLDKNVAQAAKVRSRVLWAEEDESSTSYFFRLGKRNGSNNCFTAIRADEGIRSAWLSFYKSLFSAEPTVPVIQAAMLDKLHLSLPPHEVPTCEGLFSSEEVFAALQGMAMNKSPGSDGLPVEFYWTFWDVTASMSNVHDLIRVVNGNSPPVRLVWVVKQ